MQEISPSPTATRLTTGSRTGEPQFLERVLFTCSDGARIVVPLRALSSATSEEWYGYGERFEGTSGTISYSAAGEVLVGALRCDGTGDLERSSLDAYREMIAFVRETGYPHFLRIWNHVGRINESDDGLERYRRFSVGRHEAFAEAGYRFENDLPAASAVGSHEESLVIYFLASKRAPICLENSRQVSAFQYPPLYGPRSPSFSRAAVVRWDDRAQLFLSGTASIVGHKSMHISDVGKQLDETFQNISVLLERASEIERDLAFDFSSLVSLKVYIRNDSDFPLIQSKVAALLPDLDVSYVEADICRKELLLEIEGIAESSFGS